MPPSARIAQVCQNPAATAMNVPSAGAGSGVKGSVTVAASLTAAVSESSSTWDPAGSGDVPVEHPAATSAITTSQTADRLTGIPSGCLRGRV